MQAVSWVEARWRHSASPACRPRRPGRIGRSAPRTSGPQLQMAPRRDGAAASRRPDCAGHARFVKGRALPHTPPHGSLLGAGTLARHARSRPGADVARRGPRPSMREVYLVRMPRALGFECFATVARAGGGVLGAGADRDAFIFAAPKPVKTCRGERRAAWKTC